MTATNDLKGRRVLVTGAGGFLGKHLCRRLARLGADVAAVSRSSKPDAHEHVHWRQADMSDPAVVEGLFDETSPEVVYQLCGHVDGSRDRGLVYPTLTSDVITTVHLLMAAANRPVQRFVMTASLEEPEPGGAPTSPYAAGKVASTSYGRMFHLLYQVPVILVRPYMTYGPGQADKKIIPYMTRCLLRGEGPKLGDGGRMVDWIYVDDVVDGFIAATKSEGVQGMTFDLGSGELVSIAEVAKILIRLTGARVQPQFGAGEARAKERVRIADLEPAKVKLNWSPATSLETGLQRMVDYYRTQLA